MDRLSSMGLSNSARKFLDAARLLHRQTKGICLPGYFAAGQGIELALKAYLRGCGLSEKQLIGIGHDLCELVERALKLNCGALVRFSRADLAIIKSFNPSFRGRHLQYVNSGHKSLPRLGDLLTVGERIWSGTRNFCVDHRTQHYGLPTAVL